MHTYVTADSRNSAGLAFSLLYRWPLRPWEGGDFPEPGPLVAEQDLDPHYAALVSAGEIVIMED